MRADWSGVPAARRKRAGPPPASKGERGIAARSAGRWSLLPQVIATEDADELAEAIAEQLLARWGVVFSDLLIRETLSVPWREVLWALRRMEARGTIRGSRFMNGFSGEQYAVREAVDVLRSVRKLPRSSETILLSATDPLNLVGIVLPGSRVPALPTNSITYINGAPSVRGARLIRRGHEPRSASRALIAGTGGRTCARRG